MTIGSIITCGMCGNLHGPAFGQCPMYLLTVEAEARGRAHGEGMASLERFISAYRRLRGHFSTDTTGLFRELDELCGRSP
jgi:hypothetical protein